MGNQKGEREEKEKRDREVERKEMERSGQEKDYKLWESKLTSKINKLVTFTFNFTSYIHTVSKMH